MSENQSCPHMRIGIGTDLHRLTTGRPLILGGVTIPFHSGPLGHSDGDVLIHAVCDSLLGSVALQDIGAHFSDTDPAWKDADSTLLLRAVVAMVREKGYAPVNIDATIHLEQPKLRPYIDTIRSSLAEIIGMNCEDVSVKAKTAELTGPVGEGRAIEALVVCLVSRII
jgi:2-C-methyl-D-erythritol 2,4-cyclodiphosphate synthase